MNIYSLYSAICRIDAMLAEKAYSLVKKLNIDYRLVFPHLSDFNVDFDKTLDAQITFKCRLCNTKSKQLEKLLSNQKVNFEIIDNKWKLS